MEILYAIFYTIGIMLLINYFEEVICASVLRLKGQREIEAEIVGFANNNVYPYNRGGFDYRSRSLVQVKYQLDSKEYTRFIYRDKNDWLHDKIKVRVHPKTGCVVRSGLRHTYYNCSQFTKISILIMSGIGWAIDLGLIALSLWMIITHDGSLLFVILYSLIITAIGIFVSYHLMMGEQERIDKHSYTL